MPDARNNATVIGMFEDKKKFLRCDALIQFNKIENNKHCGILAQGENNHTRIEKNLKSV